MRENYSLQHFGLCLIVFYRLLSVYNLVVDNINKYWKFGTI